MADTNVLSAPSISTYLNGQSAALRGTPGSTLFNTTPAGLPAPSPTAATPSPTPSQSIDTSSPSVSSTTLSNGNKITQVQQNQSSLNDVSQKGISTDSSGNAINANGTTARTLTGTTQNADGSTTSTYSDGTSNTTGASSNINTITAGSDVPAGWDAQTYANFKAANPGLSVTPQDTAAMQAAGQSNSLNSSTTNQQSYINANTSVEDAATQNIISQLVATSDANTATQVQAIQSQFAVREQQQSLLNASQNAALSNQLLMGGVGQSGSATSMTDTNGTILAQESYGVQQLANLDAQENTQIAAAKQAGFNNDYQTQSKLLDQINATRQAKIDLATHINDNIADTNQKMAEQTLQSNIDNSVASIYANGVTDPTQILSQLQKQGINATIAQVQSTLGTIADRNGIDPSTLDAGSKEFFYLQGIGQLPSSLQGLAPGDALTQFLAMYNNAIASGKALVAPGTPTGTNPVVSSTIDLINNGVTTPITPDMTVSQAVQAAGLPAIIAGIVQQEGGTPQGTNNPGNIKFAGQSGATQGKAATDGGYFANFNTPQDFQNAISGMISNAGSSNVADFIASYKGVTNGSAPVAGTTGSSAIDTTTQGYATAPVAGAGGLTQSAIDSAALQYATTGTMPTLRGAVPALTAQQKTAVQNRAGEISAGGNIAANKATLKSLGSTLTQQTEYATTVQRAYDTATDNLGTISSLMTKYGLNGSSIPLINQLNNAVKSGTASAGDVAAFNAALQSVRQEYSQVLAKGGSRSVSTDAEAASLIPDNLSPVQLQEVANQLSTEGQNTIKEANDTVSGVQNQINGIVSPGPVVSSTTHSGITLPSSDSSVDTGSYNGITLPN